MFFIPILLVLLGCGRTAKDRGFRHTEIPVFSKEGLLERRRIEVRVFIRWALPTAPRDGWLLFPGPAH